MFDLHVHAAPDICDRAADDTETIRYYAEASVGLRRGKIPERLVVP